jgi:hypothetical protein
VKVTVNDLRGEVKQRGFLETQDSGALTPAARTQFQRAKAALLSGSKPRLVEKEGHIWKVER